jgi:hypothetical protein
VDPSSIAADERNRAVAAARRLLRQRTAAFAGTVVSGALGALALAFVPVVGGRPLAVAAWLVVSALGLGWLVLMFVGLPADRGGRAEVGLSVNVVDEPRLHEWAVELSRRVGVTAPDAIRIAPGAGVWIDRLASEPTLVIGVGSIGWLTRDELARAVGIELATLRVREDENVRSALRLTESGRIERMCRSRAPVVGSAIRTLGHRLAVRADELREACVAWAIEAAPVELTPTDADLTEAELVEEAWALLEERWLAPAARLGLALDSVGIAHRELLAACEENALVERAYPRDAGPPALSLLRDPGGTDIELAGWSAAQLHTDEDGIVGWDEYAQRVSIPTWRQTAADVVAAVSAVSGHALPHTLDALIETLDSGLGPALGASVLDARQRALHPHSDPQPPSEQQIDAAVADAIAHTVSLAMVESELATLSLDVLWGVRLVDENDESLDVDPNVRGFLGAHDIGSLRWYLQSLGLDTSRPLPLAGVVASSPLPDGAGLVARQGWRAFDLVVSGGALLGFQHSLGAQLRGLTARLTGSYDEVTELDPELAAALDLDHHADRPPAQLAVDLDAVTRAELYRPPRGSGWTLRLAAAGKPIRLRGSGDAQLMTGLLEPYLGGRLHHTGLSFRPSAYAVVLGKVGWYTICGGVLVLLGGAVGLVNLLDAPNDQTAGTHAAQVVLTFGLVGAALIAVGLVPYRLIARRGHEPALR